MIFADMTALGNMPPWVFAFFAVMFFGGWLLGVRQVVIGKAPRPTPLEMAQQAAWIVTVCVNGWFFYYRAAAFYAPNLSENAEWVVAAPMLLYAALTVILCVNLGSQRH